MTDNREETTMEEQEKKKRKYTMSEKALAVRRKKRKPYKLSEEERRARSERAKATIGGHNKKEGTRVRVMMDEGIRDWAVGRYGTLDAALAEMARLAGYAAE